MIAICFHFDTETDPDFELEFGFDCSFDCGFNLVAILTGQQSIHFLKSATLSLLTIAS